MERDILVYVAAAADRDLIAAACARLDLVPRAAATAAEAHAVLRDQAPAGAIVDYQLPRLALPDGLRVVVIGAVNAGTVLQIMPYHPLMFMPTPLLPSSLLFALLTLTGKAADAATAPARWAGTHAVLADFAARLTALQRQPEQTLTFAESVRRFCLDACPEGKRASEIDHADRDRYEIIHLMAKRGTVFCAHGQECPLLRFLETLPPELRERRPAALLTAAPDAAPADLTAAVNTRAAAAQEALVDLYRRRHDYCEQHCPRVREGMPATPADGRVLTGFAELQAGAAPRYCAEQDCALDRFFLVLQ